MKSEKSSVEPWIDHPARQDGPVSLMDWIRYKIGLWMQDTGAQLEYRALYPGDTRCPECRGWVSRGNPCDHIPF